MQWTYVHTERRTLKPVGAQGKTEEEEEEYILYILISFFLSLADWQVWQNIFRFFIV